MNQNEFPFYETDEDATNTAIIRSGKHFKEVAVALWPDMKGDSAYAKLKNSLRPDTREHLKPSEHRFIANYCGEYDWLYFNCQGCHHSRPEPVKPEDERDALYREFIAAVAKQEKIAAQLGLKVAAGKAA